MGSASRPRPKALPSLHHCDWTISNWRAIEACRQTKSSPRASPSSGGAVGQGRPVGHAPAQDPVARGQPPLPAQRVAGVGAPHVGAARAAQAELVVAVAEVVGAQLVVAELRVGAVGAQDERAAVAPAPDELGRDELLVELQALGLLGELGAEAGDVLVQLAPHHVARVAVEGRGRRGRGPAVLVLVAQDELARLDRAPSRAAQRPPRHALVRDPLAADVLAGDALDGRLREAVGEAEVLALLAEQGGRLHVGRARARCPARAARAPSAPPRPRAPRRSARARRGGPRGRAGRRSHVPGSSPRRSARAAMPSRTSCGKPSRIHAGSSSAASARCESATLSVVSGCPAHSCSVVTGSASAARKARAARGSRTRAKRWRAKPKRCP